MGKLYIVSSTTWKDECPKGGYHETVDIDEVLDAVESALKNGAIHVGISVEDQYESESYENSYE